MQQSRDMSANLFEHIVLGRLSGDGQVGKQRNNKQGTEHGEADHCLVSGFQNTTLYSSSSITCVENTTLLAAQSLFFRPFHFKSSPLRQALLFRLVDRAELCDEWLGNQSTFSWMGTS